MSSTEPDHGARRSCVCRYVRGETIPSDAPGKFSMSVRDPLGVVAVITPFNVPLIKTTRLVCNALAVGNTWWFICRRKWRRT